MKLTPVVKKMTEPAEVLYNLAHFSSLLEVSVGINLVFSFWESLRNLAISKLTVTSVMMYEKLAANLGDEFKDSRCSAQFEMKKNSHLNRLGYLSFLARWIGILSTVLMILLLINVGFNPNTQVNFLQILVIIFFAVCISPLFLIIGNIYVYFAKSSVERYGNQQITSLEDVKEFASRTR